LLGLPTAPELVPAAGMSRALAPLIMPVVGPVNIYFAAHLCASSGAALIGQSRADVDERHQEEPEK
jgi:hypothetical protein